MRTAVTRELARKFLRATALVENSRNSDLQFTQFVAVSGEETLQREQVCTTGLLDFQLLYSGRRGLQRFFPLVRIVCSHIDIAQPNLPHHGR